MNTFNDNLSKAKRTVGMMDKIDGFKDRNLGTIIMALEAGLKGRDEHNAPNNAEYDALVMLRDLRNTIKHRQ